MADAKTETKIKGKAARDFTDAGTERTFEAGKSYDFTPGEHANYLAGGLIGEPDTKAADKPAG